MPAIGRAVSAAVLLVVGAGLALLAVLALGQRPQAQFQSTPQWMIEGTVEPMASADRESQQV